MKECTMAWKIVTEYFKWKKIDVKTIYRLLLCHHKWRELAPIVLIDH